MYFFKNIQASNTTRNSSSSFLFIPNKVSLKIICLNQLWWVSLHFHKKKCKACCSRIVKRVKTSFCQHSFVELSLAQHFFQQMNNSKLDLVNVAFPKGEFFTTFNYSEMLLNIFILLFFSGNPTAKPSKKPSLKPTAQPSRKPTGCFSFIFTIVFVPLCFWGGGAHINC